ncbi:hypothetical protein [Streptomyces griseorubiginosus]|uniref:hypothetical protein n=1 Tax=Streptomyces griseorubiginosus TaxID=67304 RepID=UPI002E804314|nr:hypothetical protein [Streptomyces griseorubiginosus]WUB47509.1 hypothetical protein OHN19_30915 [Streptomyces griseorubiginosus]WUB56034.1 hypothetical protein OG942_30925 [Streptomyces griseorubiginosus]
MTMGHDAVPELERERLRRYLGAVVAARPAPVHTAVAFNAVYFGYDLGGEGYGGSPLHLDDFPVITFGERAPVLPVGAMVCVATGSDPLYAEIVYREGAHPEVSAHGDVPAWVSGAPAGAAGPGEPGSGSTPRRRELLVPDVHAFGPALSLSPAQLHRLRTRRRWINADGHVVVDVCYPSAEGAGRDDLAAYADHLLTTAREQLLSPFVPVSLAELVGGTRDEDLRAGLLGLLDTVRGVLNSSEELRTWGHYAMTRTSLAECWRDTGPLGGDDLKSLAAAVEHAAVPAKRRHGLISPVSVYTAVGPRLRGFPGAAEQLMGVGYAAAVCRANVALADVVQRDSDQGLFANGSRVTLDDAFESGGVWRSHHPGDAEPPGDPLAPAGRGWASTLPAQPEPEPEAELDPIDLPLADEAALGPSELLQSDANGVVWRAPLRLAHLIDGWFPLHPDVVRELRRSYGRRSTLRLELDHVGEMSDEKEAVQDVTVELGDDMDRVTGILWPQGFFPGLMLEIRWVLGDTVIRVATMRLKERVRVGDRETNHCYDTRVLTREDVPGSGRHGDSAVGLGPRQLVMRTVRRCGLLTLDGHALLDRSVLPSAVYGRRPAPSQAAALESAVAELFAERVLEPALGSRDAWGQPHYPARDQQPVIPLIGYRPVRRRVIRPWGGTEPGGAGLPGIQFVPGHLRRLRPGCSPSEVQRAAFRDHCRRLGKADGWELPFGYTFVTEHTRGH